MRHVVALLLTLLTSVLSAAVVLVTGMAGGLLWPPLFLLCLFAGHLCRHRPVAGVFFGLPLCGVPVVIAFSLWLNRARKHPDPRMDLGGALLFLLVSASVAAVYMGFLRSIEAMTGGATGDHELEAMQADD